MIDYQPQFTRLPADREECWSKLEHFVSFWHKISCSPTDVMREVLKSEARLHVTLPDALIEWHSRFSRYFNFWGDRGLTLPLDLLEIHAGMLVIRTELVFNGLLEAKWGIPLREIESSDPPVILNLRTRMHPCADHVSHFAVISTAYDTVMLSHHEQLSADNQTPFPSDGKKMEFPDSFGIIETAMYEGRNWLGLVSGKTCYLRQRDSKTGQDRFTKHELLNEGRR